MDFKIIFLEIHSWRLMKQVLSPVINIYIFSSFNKEQQHQWLTCTENKKLFGFKTLIKKKGSAIIYPEFFLINLPWHLTL